MAKAPAHRSDASSPLRSPAFLVLAAASLLTVSGCRQVEGNKGPAASLSAASTCGVGELLIVDARASGDDDGAVVEYTFIFGDGTASVRTVRSEASHVYTQSGSYELMVRIVDDRGAISRASTRVEILAGGPEGPCLPPLIEGSDVGVIVVDAGSLDCVRGERRFCGAASGRCQQGEQICASDGHWGQCLGEVGPIAEACDNGVDEDCDGEIDEACPNCDLGDQRPCGVDVGLCRLGLERCVEGLWTGLCESGRGPRDERCDGQDNDCDGETDEALACECNETDVRRCGSVVGECRAGVQPCLAGEWGACDGVVGPRPESCNGLDDDCDGLIDEGCECELRSVRACGSDEGACRSGVQLCEGGAWGGCVGELEPSAESCDGRDNDCDGQIDEGCSCTELEQRACGSDLGECAAGVQQCSNGAWGGCVGATLPSAELCDGLDNDCNGIIDDLCPCSLDEERACGIAQGACQAGLQRCQQGQWGPCNGASLPADELCDDVDNDCDGALDEGLARGCSTLCGNGIERCSAGSWGGCSADQPGAESCDGQDEDCDGEIDESVERDCQTACGPGVERCVAGQLGICDGPAPVAEQCNGVDDDCDGPIDESLSLPACPLQLGVCRGSRAPCAGVAGFSDCTLIGAYGDDFQILGDACGDQLDNNCDGRVDEGCDCAVGEVRACGSDEGECQLGEQRCGGAGTWLACDGAVDPVDEVCNGLDDDCDGRADQNLERSCETACGDGEERCVQGSFVGCTAPAPSPEECNGLDDDCDGQVDEDCNCQIGETRGCGSDVGECTAGFQLCLQGQFGPCLDAVEPKAETCDGRDNNCDGLVDEGCACLSGARQRCGRDEGICSSGEQLCVDGQWAACVGEVGPVAEECNGVDDDCDGEVDELCPCQGDEARPCGSDEGACVAGTQVCDLGRWGSCEQQVGPRDEECNGEDDDCDGQIDEICECLPDEIRVCGTETGECDRGEQRCTDNGVLGPCEGGTAPAVEQCNGLDDDCDGSVDNGEVCADCAEGDTRPCGSNVGTCQGGIQVCIRGEWSEACVGEVAPRPEVCGDGLDNDCDGDPEDGCLCSDGERVSCGSNVGRCVPGTALCVNGAPGQCQGARGPSPEECNGEDDNCDGVVDEDCACLPGSTRSCGTDVGTCESGTEICAFGDWQPCLGERGPEDEECNGVDDDCDGVIDNGCDCELGSTRACGSDIGVCRTGTQRCGGGGWTPCEGAVDPGPESCGDGLDNNCDGTADEGCICQRGTRRSCGSDVGACEAGSQTCEGRFWGECVGGVGPAFEVCDGGDNDCDGVVDEDCQCQQGDLRVCGSDVGECSAGFERCNNGSFGACEDAVSPRAEDCDGLDNDCDGQVDEGCPCGFGETRSCGNDIGVCQTGVQVCAFGQFGPCLGGVRRTDESCDGLDNDCDGEVDEQGNQDVPLCDDGVGDCSHVDGYVRLGEAGCELRVHLPGVRECLPEGVCGPSLCEEFQSIGGIDCEGECSLLTGCEGLNPGFCAPRPAGTVCGAGGSCDGAGSCVELGCADGSREGFVDLGLFSDIASCGGSFVQQSLRSDKTGAACGNDGALCNSPADLCAPGWHICMRSGDPADLSSRVSDFLCDSAVAGLGQFAAASSHCTGRNSCNYPDPLFCSRRGPCAPSVCCGSGCEVGDCPDGVYPGRTPATTSTQQGCAWTGANVDGVLCCRD